jgi:hypothetical protein
MGAGTIRATITATTNGSVPSNHLQSIAFTAIDNAFVTIGSQANQQSPFNVTLPPNTSSTQVIVRRDKPNTPFRVTMNVTDACGPWPTFVGAGTGFQ